MAENPYSSPRTDSMLDPGIVPSDANVHFASMAKSVFIAWERLRIIYVVVLGAFTMMLSIPGMIANGPQLLGLHGIVMVVEGAVIANICFFGGPIIETYVRWLGYDRKWVRWFLFVGGTILTAMLALVSIALGLLPDQN